MADTSPKTPTDDLALGTGLSDAQEFQELIERVRAGSTAAEAEMIQSLQSYLLMIATRELDAGLRAKVGGSDLVQRTLSLAHQNLGDFRGKSPEMFLAWARTILRNEMNGVRRAYFETAKRDLRREVPTADGSDCKAQLVDGCPTPATEFAMDEEATALRTAMAQLSNDHRTVILLRNWERLSFDEIGARMDRSADAAKKLWARALRQLKEQLRDES